MPLPPFHLGPALLLGVLLDRRLDLPTLLLGSVVVDVRVALVLLGPLDGPVHGILTTFLGGTVVALVLAAGIRLLPPALQSALDRARPAETTSARALVAAAIVGVYSHVVLDSLLYADARPFFPADWNPFLVGDAAVVPVYAGCVVAGVLGLVALIVRDRGVAGDAPR